MPELVRDFLDPGEFFQQVKTICGIDFFCGVPDSLLKGNARLFFNLFSTGQFNLDFCAYVTKNVPSSHHIITVNEGAAVGLACGSYLATGQPSLVYLQVNDNEICNGGLRGCLFRILAWEILSIQLCRLPFRVSIVYPCCC